MQSPGREPSMEDILASIKKVIAEEKELRTGTVPASGSPAPASPPPADETEADVLELVDTLAPPVDLGPPLVDEDVAGHSRESLEKLQTVASAIPASAQPSNPLEDMIREMLRPILKQWLDDHLPGIIDEHVKREISRITGRPL